MQSQKTLQDYITRKTYWRVLKNIKYPRVKELNEMIGGIFEQHSLCDYDQTVSLYNKNKSDNWNFNISDLQKVYGQEVDGKVEYLEKDGYAIGVGDTVVVGGGNEYIVFDFTVCNGEINIRIYNKSNEPLQDTNAYYLDEIAKVIPLHPQTPIMTEEAMIAHLKSVGRIKNGKVVV